MKNALLKLEAILEIGGTKKDAALLIISAIALILSLIDIPFPFNPAWIAIILCGIPIIAEAIIGIVTAFDITADVLVALALIASVAIGEDFAAGEVAFIMQLGGLLEELTVKKARKGIEQLVKLTPESARVIRDGKTEVISADKVVAGDILRVLPGETIAADGTIIEGNTTINEQIMTGESIPSDKTIGDEVMSGTVNQFGAITIRASRDGSDSSIQRMVKLVESADADKAKIVGLADRWAVWIVIIALSAAVITWIITGEAIRAVTILVVFCPCSLVLATPTAIMAAIGNASKHGFLVKEGDALERLSQSDRIVFDKTGTLTKGELEVKAAVGKEDLMMAAASAEASSEHPLGKAVVRAYSGALLPVSEFQMIPGKGIQAKAENGMILAGTAAYLKENGIEATGDASSYEEEGDAIIHVSYGKDYLGFIALSDTEREDAEGAIKGLKALNIEPILLTGDHENAARTISEKAGITAWKASCKPEDKLSYITEEQQHGHKIAMIGDGINDAPSLKAANTGIAMGGIGSDIAMDAADIVLINDKLGKLPHLFKLSKSMMGTIKRNIAFSMSLNFISIALAIAGILNPVLGALVHNSGSVVVIISSALLLRYGKRKENLS